MAWALSIVARGSGLATGGVWGEQHSRHSRATRREEASAGLFVPL